MAEIGITGSSNAGAHTRASTALTCPDCGSRRLHRSRRDNAYERYVLGLLGVRPYRCEFCNLRFFSRRHPGR